MQPRPRDFSARLHQALSDRSPAISDLRAQSTTHSAPPRLWMLKDSRAGSDLATKHDERTVLIENSTIRTVQRKAMERRLRRDNRLAPGPLATCDQYRDPSCPSPILILQQNDRLWLHTRTGDPDDALLVLQNYGRNRRTRATALELPRVTRHAGPLEHSQISPDN